MSDATGLDTEKRLAREVARRRRTERRTAAANTENAKLRKELQDLTWKHRVLKLRVDNDEFSTRKLELANERLSLIREIVGAPLGTASTPTDSGVDTPGL